MRRDPILGGTFGLSPTGMGAELKALVRDDGGLVEARRNEHGELVGFDS